MAKVPLPPPSGELRWRHRLTLLTGGATLVLMDWGAFATSIEAGLAVPDWPSSHDSHDPFHPWPRWWRVTPLLAELHLGGVVAVVILSLWPRVQRNFRSAPALHPAARLLAILVAVQIPLGLTAWFVTLDDAETLQPGTPQVVVNTSPAVVGALLTATAALAVPAAFRRGRTPPEVPSPAASFAG